MSDLRRSPLLWGLVALALALVASAAVGGAALRDARRGDDELQVTGSARRPIRSDLAVWRLQVSAQAGDPSAAFAALGADAERVRAFLAASGLPDSAVVERPVMTEPVHRMLETGMQTGEVVGYRLTQAWEVRSPEVDRVTALSREAGELVGRGVPLVAFPPEYLYTRLGELRAELLAEAAVDARARAEAIAGSVGSEVGPVRSARMGVFQITPRGSTEVSDYGINDVTALDKDVTAVVRIGFAVE